MTDTAKQVQEYAAHSFHTWSRQKGWKAPLLVNDAEGIYFYDSTGKAYIDFSSQLMCSNLGHKNKAVIEAIVKQAEKLPYIVPSFANEASMAAVEALRTVMPKGLDKFFFSTSGTEANEAAVKMVRQACAPAYKVISRYKSYHGSTAASISLTGDPRRWYAEQARFTIPGVCFAPDSHCYRCPFELAYPQCGLQCAKYLDYMIREEGNVAAIIVEPIVGTNGRLIPPPEYYPMLRRICDEHKVLLIADEVMSGWFRTGNRVCHGTLGCHPGLHHHGQGRQRRLHAGRRHRHLGKGRPVLRRRGLLPRPHLRLPPALGRRHSGRHQRAEEGRGLRAA